MRSSRLCPRWLARVALLSLLLLVAGGGAVTPAAAATRSAIIFIIDGVRYSETFGDTTHRNIPRIWNDLRPQGTIYTECYNHGQTTTLGAHATMLDGNHSWVSFPPWDNPTPVHRPATPTLFEYFRAATGAEATQAWVTVNTGIPSLEGMTYSLHPQYGPDYGASWVLGPREDEDVVRQVEAIMDQYHPRLILVNLHGADRWAHDGNWSMYLNRLRNADALAYEMWQKIQSDPFYANQTAFVVTTDHGRHSWDFREHRGGCTGCQHIMFLALGPDIKRGAGFTSPRRHIEDIGPTLGFMMGLPMPYVMEGNVMAEMFRVRPTTLPQHYLPTQGLEVSVAVHDATGVPRTDFQPGETASFDVTVVSHADQEVLLYQEIVQGALVPDGEVGERGWYFGEPPVYLPPGGSFVWTLDCPIPSQMPAGPWPLTFEWRSVEATGTLVHGAATATVTTGAPALGGP